MFSALSVIMTWPLVLGLGRDVPGDLGDSLLNMWILGWGAEHVPQLLTGSISWAQFWNANIFHPDTHALALSEHLFGQTLQILPIYWLTGNIILCYNLLFISTFALSAFGTYLLVLDLTGDRRAAFIAGLVYGFLPYRIASVPHVQVMSSQWMPFALYGLNRFVTTGSRRALAGGTAALVMQNWSCGYYLLYFAPFLPAFLLHRMWTIGKLKDVTVWASLAVAAIATLILTLPFLFPYSEAQQLFGFERTFGEVVLYSANAWSYITASENVTLFGRMLRFYPHGEGETFLGFAPWLLAIVAVAALLRSAFRREAPEAATRSGVMAARRVVTWLLLFAVVTQLIGVLSVVMFGGFDLGPISARTPVRLLWQFVIALALLLAISPRARREGLRMVRSPVFFALAATILAMWLSLGPIPKAGDSLVSGFGLYNVLYQYVPGFNGVRAPARYAMIAGLFLAILAGYGAKRLTGTLPGATPQALLTGVLAILILAEGAAIPMELNRTWGGNEATPPARMLTYANAPPVYQRIAALPAGTAITEFPFGDPAWEIRYVYYAASHWKPITNGYSGNFPAKYSERLVRFRERSKDPEAAWRALRESQSTHVVIHRNAFANAAEADAVEAWLKSHGAIELERFPEGDILLKL